MKLLPDNMLVLVACVAVLAVCILIFVIVFKIASKFKDLKVKFAAMGLSALYILSPIDIVPDVAPIIGQIDDAGVLAFLIGLVLSVIKDRKDKNDEKNNSNMPVLILAALSLVRTVDAADEHLQNYVNMALQNNPALQAAKKNYDAENARISGLGNLESPALDIGFYPKPMKLAHGKQIAQFSIMQMFNWPGSQKAFQTEATAMARMQGAKAQSLNNELIMKVKSQWNSLAALKKKIEYKKQIFEIQKQLEDLAIADFKVSGYSTALEAGLQTLELEFEIENLQSEMQTESANFNAMLGRRLDEEILLADTLFLTEADTARTAENPMLSMLQAESEAYRNQKASFQKMSYPMFGLGLQYMLINKDEMKEGKDMFMLMGQITLPVWRSKTNASINETMLRSEAAQMSMTNMRNELDAQKAQTKRQIELAKKKISLYKKQVELTDSKHKMALQDLSAGKARFPDVLQIKIEFINYEIKEIEAIAEYNSAVANLEMIF